MSDKKDLNELRTAVRARHDNLVPASRGKSMSHERFGLKEFYNRLGRPNFQMKLWDGFTVGPQENSLGTVNFKIVQFFTNYCFQVKSHLAMAIVTVV